MATLKPSEPSGAYGQIKNLYIKTLNNGNRIYTNCQMNESDYMHISSKWLELRKECLERDKMQCTMCGSSFNLQVHHLRYPKVWGEEELHDLTTLCDDCHAKVHNKEEK